MYHKIALVLVLLFSFDIACATKTAPPVTSALPNVYKIICEQPNLPDDWKTEIEAAATEPREEVLLPLDDETLYVGYFRNIVVAIALLDSQSRLRDLRFFSARAGGFSVSWYSGLVVTIHNHPGTGMFYHQPMHVSSGNGKLIIVPTQPGWPARHAEIEPD